MFKSKSGSRIRKIAEKVNGGGEHFNDDGNHTGKPTPVTMHESAPGLTGLPVHPLVGSSEYQDAAEGMTTNGRLATSNVMPFQKLKSGK